MAVTLNDEEYQERGAEKKARRIKPLTLISGILGVIFGLILVGFAIYVGYSLLSAVWVTDKSTAGETIAFIFTGWFIIPIVFIICLMVLAVAVLNIASGIISIVAATKEDKKYIARKGLIVTSVVFDFILLIGAGIYTLSQFSKASSAGGDAAKIAILCLVVTILALFSPIVKIIDLARVSKRYNKQVSYEKAQKKFEKEHGMENDLSRYKTMYENGVITKEEYEQARAKVLGLNKE